MTEITIFRHNHLVDPHLEIWEWQIPAYLFVGGVVAGLMILNGFWRLYKSTDDGKAITLYGAIAAPVLLSLGMFFLFLDLEYKAHVLRFYGTFKISSPMSWGSWILLFVYPVQILLLALPGGIAQFKGKLSFIDPIWQFIREIAYKMPRTISISAIVLGIGLGIYTGVLLGVNAARPLWNSSLVPALFLVSGLSAGSAFAMLLRPTNLELKSLIRIDLGALVLESLFLFLFILSLASGTLASKEALHLVMGGPYTAHFWVFVVFIGLVLPIWLEIREIKHKPIPAWLSPVFVLVGGLALRWVMVMAGQLSHLPNISDLVQ